MENNNFSLIQSTSVNGINIDCYRQIGNCESGNEFWITREQIGRLLEYERPRRSIAKLHERNRDRLDMFSSVVNLTTEAGKRMTTVYSFKGLLEICRFSNQQKANDVMDKLWDIAEQIRLKGYYATPAVQSEIDALKQQVGLLEKKASLLEEQNSALRNYIQEHHTFTILGEAISLISGCISIGEGAKILAQHGLDIGQNRLFKAFRDKKLLGRRKGRQYNMPTQKAIEQGLFVINLPVGSKPAPMITTKGLQFAADLLAGRDFPILALICNQYALNV